MYYFVGLMTTGKEAVSESLANFRGFLGKNDYGECEGCNLRISIKPDHLQGAHDYLILRGCKGFEKSGEPDEDVNCLLVEHLRHTGQLDSN